MPAQTIHLPDGQNFTVTPVFAGLFFKSHELNAHPHAFPAGWTVVLHTEDDADDDIPRIDELEVDGQGNELPPREKQTHTHSYTKPTLQNDWLFISSISNPSSNDFKPAASPTRQIAMMLYVTLYWYFHQGEPDTTVTTAASKLTPEAGRPRGEWRINVKRDGVLRGRNLIPKLERMGLIASLDSAVGSDIQDDGESWAHMFVSRRMFWQTPGRLFLFTLQHANNKGSSSYPGSPASSRPGSPVRTDVAARPGHSAHFSQSDLPGAAPPITLTSVPSFPIGPFFSASHLPTYYPPAAAQYTLTNHVRHPIRPKPPRMGEVFYTRFVPSVGQYLSFRVASSSSKPVPYMGPVGPKPPEQAHLAGLSDTELLQGWLSNPRVQKFWGKYDPKFLPTALASRHAFPAIGLWDGVPFGYFEIYWVKEDILGQHIGNNAGDWDRGCHMFVGEEWARGRVPIWLSSLVHWAFCADYRTASICIEPRIDNERQVPERRCARYIVANTFGA